MKRAYQCNECGWSGTSLARGDLCPCCEEALGDGFLHEVAILTPAEKATAEKKKAEEKVAREATRKLEREQWAENSAALAVIIPFINERRLSMAYNNTAPVKHGDEGGELLAGHEAPGRIRAIWFPEAECLWVYRSEQDDYHDVWLWRPYVPVDLAKVAEKRVEMLGNPSEALLKLITGKLERGKFAEGGWIMAYKLAVLEMCDDPSTHSGIVDTIKTALLRDTLTAEERATPSSVRLASFYSRLKMVWGNSEERRKAEILGIEAEAKVAWEKRKTEAEFLQTKVKLIQQARARLDRALDAYNRDILGKKLWGKSVDALLDADERIAGTITSAKNELRTLLVRGSSEKDLAIHETEMIAWEESREGFIKESQEILDSTSICPGCGARLKPGTIKRHAKKHTAEATQRVEEERLAKERQVTYEAEQVRLTKEREGRLAAEKKRREEELREKEEELGELVIKQGLETEMMIKKLRNSPKHPASEKQIMYTESLFTEIFGYEMSEEARIKLDGASKKSVSGTITQVMALGIKQTITSGRGDQPAPSEKQLRYARSLIARVNSYEWESTRLGKVGVPFPASGVLQRLSKRDVSAVIDSLKYSVGRSNGY